MKTRSFLPVLVVLGLAFASAAAAAVDTYVIDPVHSSVAFSIRHFVSKVPGSFTTFKGTVKIDTANWSNSSVDATIEATSLSTANNQRDNHVKSDAFLDVAKFSTISFKSKAWNKTAEDTFDITGDLTIHGVTKEIVLHTKLLGIGAGTPGVQLSGWEGKTTIKRADFGVNGYEGMVGADVEITIGVEADLKK
jgi:polyisoprenoid-binding protein YceI